MDIDKLVDRFLAWELPKSVCSDPCVTTRHSQYPRYGTSLLTADEARQMFEHVLAEEAPYVSEPGVAPSTSMLLWCPECGERHIDKGEFALKKHHTHACQHCGHVWRPAIEPTIGVQFLPGFKD